MVSLMILAMMIYPVFAFEHSFIEFMHTYNVKYTNIEEALYRQDVFLENMKYIQYTEYSNT